jgi:hypothetical protein
MNWSQCKNFGLTDIDPRTNTVKLFYNEYSYQIAGSPINLVVESANWQGNNLIVKGFDPHGRRRIYVMNDFHSYREVQI